MPYPVDFIFRVLIALLLLVFPFFLFFVLTLFHPDNSPCAVVTCQHYSTCVLTNNGSAKCVCPEGCPFLYRPVCGSNGKSFFNRCYLRQYACANKMALTEAYEGKCGKDHCSVCNYLCRIKFQFICHFIKKLYSAMPDMKTSVEAAVRKPYSLQCI